MLTELRIRNFAIIESVTLPLGEGFNVLSGETGAGKSIIVGALGLLLGEPVAFLQRFDLEAVNPVHNLVELFFQLLIRADAHRPLRQDLESLVEILLRGVQVAGGIVRLPCLEFLLCLLDGHIHRIRR